MESSYNRPQNLKDGTQTNKTVKSRVTLNSTYQNNLSQFPTKENHEGSGTNVGQDRNTQIAVFTNSSVLESKESNGSKSQLQKDVSKKIAESRNTFAEMRASSQQGFSKRNLGADGFIPNFANFHQFNNTGMHHTNQKCNQSMQFPHTNQTPLTGLGGSMHHSKEFESSEHSYPRYYYRDLNRNDPNGPRELQNFKGLKSHHRVKTNQMGRSHKISDVLAWMNHGNNQMNVTSSDWGQTNQPEFNQFSNRLNVVESRHQKAKSVMGKIHPKDRPYQDDYSSELNRDSHMAFGQNRYSQADPSEQDRAYFEKFQIEELTRIKFRKDMQRSLEMNLKKKRKWQFQQYLNEQNAKLMNNSMSLKQSFKENDSQLSFTSEINSLKRAATNHAQSRRAKSRLHNLSNISNLKNLQEIKKIMNQGAKIADLSSNQVNQKEPKPEYINYGAHKHRLNSVQDFNPIEVTNGNQTNFVKNLEIDQIKNRYAQSQYSDNLGTYNELLSKQIEQVNVSRQQQSSVLNSSQKKAKKPDKDFVGSRNQSVNAIKWNNGTLESSELCMISMNQALAPDFKIYKKTSKYEPKKTKSMIVHQMQETNKVKFQKAKDTPEKGKGDKNSLKESPGQEGRERKNVMIDSDGSEVESFDSGRNFTVLNRQELKLQALQSSSPGKKDLQVDTAKKDLKLETATGASPMRFSESLRQDETIVSNNDTFKPIQSPLMSKAGSFKKKLTQSKLQERGSPSKFSEHLTEIEEKPPVLEKPLKSSEKHVQEQIMNSTDLAVSHAVLQTKYQINPLDHEALYKILDENHEKRKEYLEIFIDKIMATMPIHNRNAFRLDLAKYLVKQRSLLNIQNQLEHDVWVQQQYREKAERENLSGQVEAKDAKRHDKILKKKQKEKKLEEDVDFDKIKCPIHQKIIEFAESKGDVNIYMPNCCKVDKNNALCFDEYKDETPPEGLNKVIWFKEGGYDQFFKEHYQDVDENFLANMESFLKFQFKGIQHQKSKKIKALDVVLNLMNQKNEVVQIKHDPANQKLAQDYHEKSVFDVDPDLVPMNVLQLDEDQIIHLKSVPAQYRKMLTQGVRMKNEKKVLDGMNRLMSQNLGLLMGSSVAQQIDESKVQVDVRQLYMPNINNSQLITNKMIMKELLPGKDFNSNKIVLGRSMQDRHDRDITQLLGLQPKKPDILVNVIQASLKKAKTKISKQNEQVKEGQPTSEVTSLQNKSPENIETKTKDIFELSKQRAGKAVQKIMAKKYEREHQERLIQQKLKHNLEDLDCFNWKDIDPKSQSIIALISKEYDRAQEEQASRDGAEKFAFATPRNFQADMKMEQDAQDSIVARDQFMKIIMDLLREQIDQINAEMNKLPTETPASPGSPESGHHHHDDNQHLNHAHTVGSRAQTFGLFKNKCQHDLIEQNAMAISEMGTLQKQSIYNVFTKYTNQKQFYRDIKNNPSDLTDTEQKNVDFHYKCHQNKCLSLPTFSHMIKGNTIHMNSYRMDIPLVEAFVQHIYETCFTPDNRKNIEQVIINDCGFADQQVSSIINLLSHLRSAPVLASLTKDEVGANTVNALCKAIEKGLQKLVLDQIKIPEKNHLPQIFQQLESQSNLRYLSIVSVNLASNPHVFESLLQFLKNPSRLIGLKLQNNNFKSRHILKITEALTENRDVQDCDLCSNKLCRKEKETNQLILKNLALFAFNDANLRHLSLQGMHLGLALEVETTLVNKIAEKNIPTAKNNTKKPKAKKDKAKTKEPGETKKVTEENEMPENAFESLIQVLAESHSLQCVNLSNNGFTDEQVSYIKNKFRVLLDNPAQNSRQRAIKLERLRNMYLTYEVQNNPKLTDHAKIINNELLNQLTETKQLSKENKNLDPSLIDIFHENLIFQRKIGHSELVFSCQEQFMGGLQKEFSKKWRYDQEKTKNFQYVQMFFRRETILDDFEIIKDANMLQILDTVYDIKNTLKEERQLNPSADHTTPIIFGSVTDWNMQKMLGAHIFATLLNYYYLKGELKKLGKHLETVYAQDSSSPAFSKFLEEQFETMIEKVLKNQKLLNSEDFNENVPSWETILHNFKKVNKEIVQVNMLQGLNALDTDNYAFSAYLKPGLHSIIIYDPVEMLYYKKTIVIEMSQNPKTKIKQENIIEELKHELEQDKLKTASCFVNWQPDRVPREGNHHDKSKYKIAPRLLQAFQFDFIPKNFKPYLFISDQSDINLCLDHFEDHIIEIKSLYLYLSTTVGDNYSKNESLNYPFISHNRIKDFCLEINIMEENLMEDQVQEKALTKVKLKKKGKSVNSKKSTSKKNLKEEGSLADLEIKKNATAMPQDVNDDQNMLSDDAQSPDPSEIHKQQTMAASKSTHHAMLKEEQIDEIFHQANVEYEDDDANPDELLNRVELTEFILRLAVTQRLMVMKKWQMTQNFQRDEIWRNNNQLAVLMKDYILPYEKEKIRALIDFRDKRLLKMRDVSVLLEANFRGISLLYNQYMTKGFEKQFTFKSLQEMLFDSRLNLKFDAKKLPLFFGASKMTVVNEAKESAQYFKLELVEFQVLICLLARNYFEDDLGMVGYALTGEALEIYGHIKSHGTSFSSEMVHFMLNELFSVVDVKCFDFEDIKNQRAFLEGVQI